MKRVLINHWLLIYVLIMLFFSAILKDDKDDDNLTLVSKAFKMKHLSLRLKISSSAFLQSEHGN